MGLETNTGWRMACDHDGCATVCPDEDAEVGWFHGRTARSEVEEAAVGSDWVTLNGRWLCPEHWTIDDYDETVEVGADAHTGRVRVDPVVVTCAVRYALGRSSYMPGLMADQVRACWEDLGDQREVIREDVRRWLVDEMPASWMVDRETWEILDRWMGDAS